MRFNDGNSNPGYDGDSINLERGSNSLEKNVESSDSKEPVYWEIPDKKKNAYFEVDSADSNSGYQELNNVNRTSSTLYGKMNSFVHPYEVNLAQSEV